MFKFVATKNSTEIFHRAVMQNDVSRTRLILEEAMKDPRFNIDEINSEGLTALQFSCFAGNLEIVKILIQCGADWRIKDREGLSLLHASAMAGTVEVAKFLLRQGLRPTLKNDNNCMPIDLTEDTALIVLFLKAMLDQGFLREMQEYMLDHPRLKRKIFKDLELAKMQEREQINSMKDLPYTSHRNARVQKLNEESGRSRGKSRGTFSELSDSISSLNMIPSSEDADGEKTLKRDKNENYYSNTNTDLETSHVGLSRKGSSSSTHSGSSAHSSQKQFILEDAVSSNRPARTNKYSSDSDISAATVRSIPPYHHSHSEGYGSDGFDDTRSKQRRPVSRNSSSSSQSSNHSRVSNLSAPAKMVSDNSSSNLSVQHSTVGDEPVYANLPLKVKRNLDSINESLYENLPLRSSNAPPPLPPREPTRRVVEPIPYEVPTLHSPDLPNETDSGIDVNEAAGRVFQLSIDEQRDPQYGSTYQNDYRGRDPYFDAPAITSDDHSLPFGYFVNKSMQPPGVPGKYHSWNVHTMHEENQSQFPNDLRLRQRAEEYERLRNHRISAPPNIAEEFEEYKATQSERNVHVTNGHDPSISQGGWIHSESGKFYPEILL